MFMRSVSHTYINTMPKGTAGEQSVYKSDTKQMGVLQLLYCNSA